MPPPKPLTASRGIQYMQLDYFKLYTYCVDQGILKRGRRRTPLASASGAQAPAGNPTVQDNRALEAAEQALIRLFSDMLKSLFGDAKISKMRNVLEFTVPLPDGGWWHDRNMRIRPEIDSLGTEASGAYDRYVRFRKSDDYMRLPLRVEIAPDGEPGSSRWNRRRYETLLRNGRSKGRFHEAAKAAVAWKGRMDALMAEVHADDDGNQNADRA